MTNARFLLLVFLLAYTNLFNAQNVSTQALISGKVISEDDKSALSLCNIALFHASNDTVHRQDSLVCGTVSDDNGAFSLHTAAGDYRLRCTMIGYQTIEKVISVAENNKEILLEMSPLSQTLKEVVVTGRLIEKKADRFVMNMLNNPLVKDKMVSSILSYIPGVSGLSIYGRGGTKVFINNHELKLDDSQKMQYLAGLSSNNVLKIEAIPYAGSSHDADSKGGILKITLRKMPKGGVMGTANLPVSSTSAGEITLHPSVSASYNAGKLSTFTFMNFGHIKETEKMENQTNYLREQDVLKEYNRNIRSQNSVTLDQSVFYDINRNHSIAFDFNCFIKPNEAARNTSIASYRNVKNEALYDLTGNDRSKEEMYFYNGFLNYSLKLDTLGSQVKFVVDYLYREHRHSENLKEDYTYPEGNNTSEQSKSISHPIRNTFSPYFDTEWVINDETTIEFGAKYLGMWANGGQTYYGLTDNDWQMKKDEEIKYKYQEQISAGYINVSSSIKEKFLYAIGLRYENTYSLFNSLNNDMKNKLTYNSWFPTIDLTYMFNEDKGNMLGLNFSRSIERPTLWQLDPSRYKDGNMTYTAGNTDIKAYYLNSVSLTQTFLNKFNANLSVEWANNVFDQVVIPVNGSDTLMMTDANYGNQICYRLYLSGGGYVTKHWYLSSNAELNYKHEHTYSYGDFNHFSANISIANFFKIKKWTFNLGGSWQSKSRQANSTTLSYYSVSAGLGRDIVKNLHFNASVANLLHNSIKMRYEDKTFQRWTDILSNRRSFHISLSYQFNVGKKNIQEKKAKADYDVKVRG